MKNLERLIHNIQKSNLSGTDKKELIALLGDKNINYSSFVIAFIRMIGVAGDVFEKFDIDVGELFDKYL